MKRKKWKLWLDGTSLLVLRTPWFGLILSAGGWDYPANFKWWGYELRWGGDWNCPEGQYPYKHYRRRELRRQFACDRV